MTPAEIDRLGAFALLGPGFCGGDFLLVDLSDAPADGPAVVYAPYERTRQFYTRRGFCLVDVIEPYPGWDEWNPCAVYVRAL